MSGVGGSRAVGAEPLLGKQVILSCQRNCVEQAGEGRE